ncbi:hypothetical protein ABBQ38_014142 [Trebouxia sp. C0009 RCD-2024]
MFLSHASETALYATHQPSVSSRCSSLGITTITGLHSVTTCPDDTLQDDIVDAQNAGGCIIVCGDMNARTAEQADYISLADLQGFVDVPEEGAYLGAEVTQRCYDKAPTAGTWGDELQ